MVIRPADPGGARNSRDVRPDVAAARPDRPGRRGDRSGRPAGPSPQTVRSRRDDHPTRPDRSRAGTARGPPGKPYPEAGASSRFW
jgi:hypothetical protein